MRLLALVNVIAVALWLCLWALVDNLWGVA